MSLLVLVLFLEATGLYLEGCGPLQPSLWIHHWEIFFLLSVSQFCCLIHSVAFYFSSLQCKKFRDKLTPDKRKIYKEKLQASEVFKDKKSSYPLTWVARVLINAYFELWESLGLCCIERFHSRGQHLGSRVREKNMRGLHSPLHHFEMHCIFLKRLHLG